MPPSIFSFVTQDPWGLDWVISKVGTSPNMFYDDIIDDAIMTSSMTSQYQSSITCDFTLQSYSIF